MAGEDTHHVPMGCSRCGLLRHAHPGDVIFRRSGGTSVQRWVHPVWGNVVVKTIRSDDVPTAVHRESQLQARAAHQNVVRIFAWTVETVTTRRRSRPSEGKGSARKTPAKHTRVTIVMEAGAGEITRWRGSGRCAVFCLLTNVTRGLAHLHSLGIAHNDLKAENVVFMVTAEARTGRNAEQLPRGTVAKLCDFGAACEATPGRRSRGLLVGTPHALSPQQSLVVAHYQRVRHAPARRCTAPWVDMCANDVWALGIVWYEVLTRRRLWSRPCLDDAVFAMYARAGVLPSRPTRWQQPLFVLMRKMLALEERDRPPATEVLSELLRIATNAPCKHAVGAKHKDCIQDRSGRGG